MLSAKIGERRKQVTARYGRKSRLYDQFTRHVNGKHGQNIAVLYHN